MCFYAIKWHLCHSYQDGMIQIIQKCNIYIDFKMSPAIQIAGT